MSKPKKTFRFMLLDKTGAARSDVAAYFRSAKGQAELDAVRRLRERAEKLQRNSKATQESSDLPEAEAG